MCIGRAFPYVILMFSVVTFVRPDAPPTIKYICTNNGVELVDASNVGHVAVSMGHSSLRTYCKPTNKQLNPCRVLENKFSMSVLYEDESGPTIIGGKSIGFYKLNCANLPTNITRNTTVFTAKSEPTGEIPETDKRLESFKLLLKNNNQNVDQNTVLKIGDKLQLQMIGTVDVLITPIRCVAYPVNNKLKNITIWRLHDVQSQGDKNCANEDPAIVETAKWSQITQGEPSIEINIFAFRFLKSAEVAIECVATLCAKGDTMGCKQTCVNAKLRKRRSIEHIVGKDKSKHVGSVSFVVTENELLDNSSTGLSVGYRMMATVGVVLAFFV